MEAYQRFKILKAKMELEISREKSRLRAQILAEVRECVSMFEFTSQDVFRDTLQSARKKQPLYFNPSTGKTWSGVGKEPLWLKGKDRSDYLIKNYREERESSVSSGNAPENCD
jgi:DNA-binding protein H-NS